MALVTQGLGSATLITEGLGVNGGVGIVTGPMEPFLEFILLTYDTLIHAGFTSTSIYTAVLGTVYNTPSIIPAGMTLTQAQVYIQEVVANMAQQSQPLSGAIQSAYISNPSI